MLSLFWYAIIYVLPSFAIILVRKRDLVALLLLSFGGLVTVDVLWLFPMVLWVCGISRSYSFTFLKVTIKITK